MPTSSSVGPKPKISVCQSGVPVSSGLALTVTFLSSISRSRPSSANDGRSVSKLSSLRALPSSGLYVVFLRKSPWIESPWEVTSLTLPCSTCSRKNVYGTLIRCSGRERIALSARFRTSATAMNSQIRRERGTIGGFGGRFLGGGAPPPRGWGLGGAPRPPGLGVRRVRLAFGGSGLRHGPVVETNRPVPSRRARKGTDPFLAL